jgi:hypothetical protein
VFNQIFTNVGYYQYLFQNTEASNVLHVRTSITKVKSHHISHLTTLYPEDDDGRSAGRFN